MTTTGAISEEYVDTASRPSALRITDLRVANLHGVPFRSSIIRVDTNQGLVGYGEVRDQASASYALMLKSRLLGENPCNLDKVFRKIKQFGHHGRQGGGVSGIEMALMDLAGKAYGVPAYALVGGQFRDRVRCYADTPSMTDPQEMGQRLLERRRRGFTMLKMDLGVNLLWDVPGALIAPPERGVAMALHLAASPIATMACVHLAAATENFLALEHHAADVPFWSELVTGLPRPLIQDGGIAVPDTPGLGFGDINEDLFARQLDPRAPDLFAETGQWDNEASHDRLWS